MVVLKTYRDRMSAEVDRSLLDSESIPALVTSDDEGGMNSMLGATTGVRLLVSEDHLEEAVKLLEG